MSQEKVDKYKKEKKNRVKTIKRKKIRKVVAILVVSLGIGAVLGVTVGRKYYDYIHEKELASRTITAAYANDWFNNYYDRHYSDFYVVEDEATDTDAASDLDAE